MTFPAGHFYTLSSFSEPRSRGLCFFTHVNVVPTFSTCNMYDFRRINPKHFSGYIHVFLFLFFLPTNTRKGRY